MPTPPNPKHVNLRIGRSKPCPNPPFPRSSFSRCSRTKRRPGPTSKTCLPEGPAPCAEAEGDHRAGRRFTVATSAVKTAVRTARSSAATFHCTIDLRDVPIAGRKGIFQPATGEGNRDHPKSAGLSCIDSGKVTRNGVESVFRGHGAA